MNKKRKWKDKNIKYETKFIYKILCAERSDRSEFTSISIGRVQKRLSISNVGFKKNLQILEDNKYIRFNEYDRGLSRVLQFDFLIIATLPLYIKGFVLSNFYNLYLV